jgi:membrane protease YdiL (CAAX protease family)
VTHLRGGALVYQTLLRIPVGTALLEEFAFRGLLYGAWLDRGPLDAALLSSIVFGLWHVGPSINMARANDRDVGVTIVTTVAFTTVVGLVFVALREWSGSLAFPLALHAGVNSLATLAAVRAGTSEGTLDDGRGIA